MDGLVRDLSRFLIIAGIFAAAVAIIWLLPRTRFHRDWEKRELEREMKERKSRPKPPWADDPIANSIEWTGTAAFGGDGTANPKGAFVRLATFSANRIEFHPPSTRKWHVVMLVLGVVTYLLAFTATGSLTTALVAPFICSMLSVLAELYTRSFVECLTFDKQLGTYWRGKTAPGSLTSVSTENSGRISDVYALQLVSTRRYVGNPRVGVDGSGYKEFPTHELNLVLTDATRLSIVLDDDYGRIDRGAQVLADFLQKPLWKPYAN